MDRRPADEHRIASLDYRVRFDEAGESGTVHPAWYLRVAQDAAWIHAERLGFTRARYAAEGIAWLVRAIALEVRAPARHGERLTVTTRIVGYRRIWARRRTEVTHDGLPVADVITDWILVGPDGRPQRIPAEVIERLPGLDDAIEPIRVGTLTPPHDVVTAEDAVRPDELDPMGHVNNAAYLDRLMAIAGRVRPTPPAGLFDRPSVLIEYAAAAGPGERVSELAWPTPDGRGLAYRMVAADGREIVRAVLTGSAA